MTSSAINDRRLAFNPLREASHSQICDDRLLLQLAAEPARPLFPLLRYAGAMTPLVAVIAFLPAVYALEYRTTSDLGALWGIQSLERMAAHGVNGFVDPGSTDPAVPFKWQPPLMGAMNALSMAILGPQRESSVVIPAVLCTAALIFSAGMLARRLGGERLGVLTALLMAANPEILRLAQEPLPHAASLLFSVLCLGPVVAHWEMSHHAISIRLVPAGVALGLCVLAGGPVAFAPAAGLALLALGRKSRSVLWAGSQQEASRKPVHFGREIAAVGVVVVTAFAVSGWWELMMASRYGSDFWWGWFSWTSPRSSAEAAASGPRSFLDVLINFNHWMLPMISFALLGAFRIMRGSSNDGENAFRMLPLAWLLGGVWLWTVADLCFIPNELAEGAWRSMLVVPLILLAGAGLLEIEERRVSYPVSLAVILPAVAQSLWMFWSAFQQARGRPTAEPSLSAVQATLAGIAALAAAIFWFGRGYAARRRTVLSVLTVAALLACFARGAWCIRRTTDDDRELAGLRAALIKLPNLKHCSLASMRAASPATSEFPPPLIYIVRSLWPAARVNQAGSWEAAAAQLASVELQNDTPQMILVWGIRGQPNLPGGSAVLKPVGPVCFYRGHEIAAYQRVSPF